MKFRFFTHKSGWLNPHTLVIGMSNDLSLQFRIFKDGSAKRCKSKLIFNKKELNALIYWGIWKEISFEELIKRLNEK